MPLAVRSVLAVVCLWTSVALHAETEVELRTRVVSGLRLVHVPGELIPQSLFTRDQDPQTIEIVRTDARGERGSVSDDGQVIYLHRSASSKSEEKLVERAFEIHFSRARARQPNPSLERP
jgi:hypothetical protein